jgi:hypothetical protein
MMKKLLLITQLLLISSMPLFARMKTCQISGTTDFSGEGDTISITVSPYNGRLNEIAENYSVVIRSGRFGIAIPAGDKARYVQVLFNRPESKYLPLVLLFRGTTSRYPSKMGKSAIPDPRLQDSSLNSSCRISLIVLCGKINCVLRLRP